MTSNPLLLFERWRDQLERRQSAHYLSAEHCRRINNWLGIPVIICTAVVGSTVFATLSDEFGDSLWLKIVLGVTSLLATVLASLQTFLKYSERAEQHLAANRRFSQLKREIEFHIDFPPEPGAVQQTLAELRGRIDHAIEQSTPALEHAWRRVRKGKRSQIQQPQSADGLSEVLPDIEMDKRGLRQ